MTGLHQRTGLGTAPGRAGPAARRGGCAPAGPAGARAARPGAADHPRRRDR
jgi:hypothetical protein